MTIRCARDLETNSHLESPAAIFIEKNFIREAPLKHLEQLSTMVSWGLMGALDWVPIMLRDASLSGASYNDNALVIIISYYQQ